MLSTHIDTFVESHLVHKWYSEKTIENYRLCLSRFVKHCQDIPIVHVNVNMVDSFAIMLGRKYGLGPSSINLALSSIRSLLSYLKKRNIECINPESIELVKTRSQEMYVCTPAQVEQMICACDNIRDRAIIHVLFSTLIRVSECANIKLSDIDMDNRKMVIIGKWGRRRVVFLSQVAHSNLERYFALRTDFSKYLFVSESNNSSGQRLSRNSIEEIVRKAAIRAGIPGRVTPHTLRRSGAVFMLQNSIDIRVVQLLLWHASIETTMIYLQLSDIYLQNQHKSVYDILELSR